MKKFTLFFLVTFIIQIVLFSQALLNEAVGQSCLPEGISFTKQAQVDNFQFTTYNYLGNQV